MKVQIGVAVSSCVTGDTNVRVVYLFECCWVVGLW